MLQATHAPISMHISRPRRQAAAVATQRATAPPTDTGSMAAPLTLGVIVLCTPLAAATIAVITALSA